MFTSLFNVDGGQEEEGMWSPFYNGGGSEIVREGNKIFSIANWLDKDSQFSISLPQQ